MAKISIVNALVFAVAAVMAAAVSAQEAPAPAPAAGAGFSVAASGAMVVASLLVSSVALLRQ